MLTHEARALPKRLKVEAASGRRFIFQKISSPGGVVRKLEGWGIIHTENGLKANVITKIRDKINWIRCDLNKGGDEVTLIIT